MNSQTQAAEVASQKFLTMDPLSMFLHADPVVQAVMVLLIGLSVWTWGIFIEKSCAMRRTQRQAQEFLTHFRATGSLEAGTELMTSDAAMAHMLNTGMKEVGLSAAEGLTATPELRERVKERVGNVMALVEAEETERLNSSMSVLATIGSTSPFIGLFGTVWGIMHSFIGIAQTQTTNLAVVAPGIAEALMTTAFGLFAAIPAVMIYNKFARDIAQFTGRLDAFGGEFAAVLSRHLDRKAL